MEIKFEVIDKDLQPILGARTCIQYKLITINEFDQVYNILSSKEQVIEKYEDVFTGLGKIGKPCKIVLNDQVKPVIHANRKIPLAYYDQLKKQLKEMEE